jgi:hypothetical protein
VVVRGERKVLWRGCVLDFVLVARERERHDEHGRALVAAGLIKPCGAAAVLGSVRVTERRDGTTQWRSLGARGARYRPVQMFGDSVVRERVASGANGRDRFPPSHW